MLKKQRHTAARIWQILQQEGFTGSYTIVKDAVREIRKTSKEAFMPLKHPPGEAQADFGHALVRISGILRKVFFFVTVLLSSDASFVRAYDRECTQSFWDDHVWVLKFFGGVALRITYDNTKIIASKIIGLCPRHLTNGFLLSYFGQYLNNFSMASSLSQIQRSIPSVIFSIHIGTTISTYRLSNGLKHSCVGAIEV